MVYRVELRMRRFVVLFGYKLHQFGLRKCPTDLPTKLITVTKISRHFTHKMAAKNGGHRYETKLRYCRPV